MIRFYFLKIVMAIGVIIAGCSIIFRSLIDVVKMTPEEMMERIERNNKGF